MLYVSYSDITSLTTAWMTFLSTVGSPQPQQFDLHTRGQHLVASTVTCELIPRLGLTI